MADEDIKNFGYKVERLKNKIDTLNINGDFYEISRDIKELKESLEQYFTKADELDADLNDSSEISSKKPLINKLSQNRSDLEISKRKLLEKENQFNSKNALKRMENSTGADFNKYQRDAILEQHRETDIQGDMINHIGENIRGANQNLGAMQSELKRQGEQMNRIHNTALEADAQVRRTADVMSKMERRQLCMKILGTIATWLFGIFDVALVVYYLFREFGGKK